MKPLHNAFTKFMGQATRLVHKKSPLGDATALLQQLLRRSQVNRPPTAPAAPTAAPPAAPTEADVLDGLVTEVDAPAADKAAGSGQFSSHTEADGRQYKLFVPAGIPQGQRLPLVVMLHGCTQDPDDFAAGTRMNELAQAQGFMVLYPAQPQRSNASKCWNWFQPGDQRRDRGEPAVLAGITRRVLATHPVDERRVYVAGLSAGGAMAAIMGREYPDLYAASGVHSGLPQGAAHDVASAFAAMQGRPAMKTAWPTGTAASAPANGGGGAPTIVFHGDSDKTVHPGNGQKVVADALGAGGPAAEVTQGSAGGKAFTRSVYADAAGRPRAEHWVVHGAGHAWSGGSPAGSYADAQGPDASREMLRFFLQHARA